MNWTLLITVTLTLSNLFNIGLVCINDTDTSQAQFNNDIVQEVENDSITQILGEPEELAVEAIPDMEYLPDYDDYNYDNPYLPGMYSSFNILILTFNICTTVSEVNAILYEINAEIVAGYPGIEGVIEGQLIIRVPTNNYDELLAVLELLHTKPAVMIASFDVGLSIIQPLPDDAI